MTLALFLLKLTCESYLGLVITSTTAVGRCALRCEPVCPCLQHVSELHHLLTLFGIYNTIVTSQTHALLSPFPSALYIGSLPIPMGTIIMVEDTELAPSMDDDNKVESLPRWATFGFLDRT